MITQFINSKTQFIQVKNANIKYDNGGIFITVATGLLIINYFIYMIAG